jgi:sodium-coupled neutral amino acid transporter 11
MILGDFLSPIVQQPRNACIIAVTAACLYPLALLPSLDALAPVSFVGVIGSFVTCAVMFYQWKFSSSYRLPSGYFLASLARDKQPTFGVRGTSSNPLSALVLVSMAATSYLCHFSAPEFLASLKGCLKDYRAVTFMGFAGVGIINVAIMCAGYLTFGGNSSGLILNSYAQKDVLAGVCRLLMALSVVGSFPFQLNGARNALYNTFFSKKPSKRLDHAVTVALLCGVTIPALSLRNAGIVVSINGALMGSAIAYIFPALLMLKQKKHRFFGTFERIGNGLVLAWGIMAAIVGVSVSLLSVYSPQVLL